MKKLLILLALMAPGTLYAQVPAAISPNASNQIVAAWKARNDSTPFACVYAHWDSTKVFQIDSIGPSVSRQNAFCKTGVIKFLADMPDQRLAFSDMMVGMREHPEWTIVGEIFGSIKMTKGPVAEAPRAYYILNVPKTDQS